MNEELKEYTCNIVIDFGRSYMAKDEEEFRQMVSDDFYEEHGIKLAYSEIRNITEVKHNGDKMREDLISITIPIYHSVDDKKIIIDRELMIRDLEAQIDRIELKLWEESQ